MHPAGLQVTTAIVVVCVCLAFRAQISYGRDLLPIFAKNMQYETFY